MNFDWKNVVKNVAPALGNAIGGPLGGAAISVLSKIILGDESTEDDLQKAILNGLSPDAIIQLKKADQEFSLEMQRISSETQKSYLLDIQDARKNNSSNKNVFALGCLIIFTFGVVVAFTLWGSYELITGGMQNKDPGVVATVAGIIGTVTGYVASNVQQVVGFFFGSSSGSDKKTDALMDAFVKVGKNN